MFEAKLRTKISQIIAPLAQKIAAMGITANMITILGLIVNFIAAYCLATERLALAGLLILFGGSFDMMDGAVARARATSGNSSGALLDSVIDRYSEAIIFLGALIYFYNIPNLSGVILVFAAVIGSILVSYVRARAEGLQIECKVGLMQRPERIVLLALGVLVQGLIPMKYAFLQSSGLILLTVFAVLAITSHVTAIHRLVFSFYELSDR
jgi:CDP-diacylglycerol--glycerol-3-phosphate 3-phosphatidyltransferase